MPGQSSSPAKRVQPSSRRSSSGVPKRSSNACSRCRRQKIKCSGTQPCVACQKRRLSCEFDERDQKILVTRGYIYDLQQQAAQASVADESHAVSAAACRYHSPSEDGEKPSAEPVSPLPIRHPNASSSSLTLGIVSRDLRARPRLRPRSPLGSPTIESSEGSSISHGASDNGLDPVASSLVNPMSAGKSTYITSKEGRDFYLGTSSNWSFSLRVLNLAHEHVHSSPIPSERLLFDGSAYDLGWDGARLDSLPEAPVLPSLDHSLHLIQTVKFHCGQLFHLFDEEELVTYIYAFYDEPIEYIRKAELRYIHLLVLLAFGKAFTETASDGSKQPRGMAYFVFALRLLPNVHILVSDPHLSCELLICIALFFQCVDYRHSSHCFIGQAMRIAQGQGFHSDMPLERFGEHLLERSRRIWWTIYVLDREMSSLMGQPQSIYDGDICAQHPCAAMSSQRAAAIEMHIEICRSIASIGQGIYGANGRLSNKFLLSTKSVLGKLAGLADKLQRDFSLEVDKAVHGLNRSSAYLHLLYHQSVVLATRPLLLCFLKLRFESSAAVREGRTSSQIVWELIKMCISSSYQMINILESLQAQGLLETFLPFDLEFLTVSSLNLLIAPVLDQCFLEQYRRFMVKAKALFDDFVRKGNLISTYRRSELQQLEDMLEPYLVSYSQATPAASVAVLPSSPQRGVTTDDVSEDSGVSMGLQGEMGSEMMSLLIPTDGLSAETWFTTAHMMDIANSIGETDHAWMSETIVNHDIW